MPAGMDPSSSGDNPGGTADAATLHHSQAFADDHRDPIVRVEDPGTISVNFSASLSPEARLEKVKQLAKNHEAIVSSRQINETLVHVQQTLRKLPGIPACESDDMVDKLKTIGQVVSQELSQLVDAVLYMRLDAEENRRNMAKVSLRANLQESHIGDLQSAFMFQASELEKVKTELQEQKRVAGADSQGNMTAVARLTDVNKQWRQVQGSQERRQNSGSDISKANFELMKQCLQDTLKRMSDQKKSTPKVPTTSPITPTDEVNQEVGQGTDPLKPLGTTWSVRNSFGSSTVKENPEVSNLTPMTDTSVKLAPRRSFTPAYGPGPHYRPPTVAPSANFKYGYHHPPVSMQNFSHGPPRSHNPARPPSRFAQWAANANPLPGPPLSNQGHLFPSPMGRAASQRLYSDQFPQPRPPLNSFSLAFDATPASRTPAPFPRREEGVNTPARPGHYEAPLQAPPVDYSTVATPGMSQAVVKNNVHHQAGNLISLTPRTLMAWREQINGIYDMIRHFVNHLAFNTDPEAGRRLRHIPLWEALKKCYQPLGHAEASAYIAVHMKDPVAKPCLVTRVLIDFIVNLVWNPLAWKGFDEDTTLALMEVKTQLDGCGGPPGFPKQPLLDQLASVIDSIQKNPNARSFNMHKIEQLTEALEMHVRPLLNTGVSPMEVRNMLQPVAARAWNMSSKILTSRLTFDFRFPDVGGRFSQQSMLPIWPDVDPMELQAKHWRVALVTTPVVTCRNDTGNNISAHSVSQADVYCMQ